MLNLTRGSTNLTMYLQLGQKLFSLKAYKMGLQKVRPLPIPKSLKSLKITPVSFAFFCKDELILKPAYLRVTPTCDNE